MARSIGWALPLTWAWWAVSEGRPGSWEVGVPAVALAALLAARAPARSLRRPRAWPLARFALWFVGRSFLGGVDAARRALAPSLPIAPGLLDLETSLPEGTARVLLADAVSLLPGTVVVELDGPRMLLHALDAAEAERGFREAEARVAAVFAPGSEVVP